MSLKMVILHKGATSGLWAPLAIPATASGANNNFHWNMTSPPIGSLEMRPSWY